MEKSLTILSAILLLFLSFGADAQDKDTKTYAKSYLSLIGGVSTPTGDFGRYDYSNNKAGFAKKGITAGLDGAIYIYKNLAIGASLTFQDQGELTQNDVQNLSNGYNIDFNKNETTVTAVNRYHNFNFMAGPQYSFTYDSFTLDLRAEAGIIKSTSTPSFIVLFDNSTTTTDAIEQHSSEARAFAYGGSAGLRYNIGGNWDIGLKANYINSSGIAITNVNNPGTAGRFVTKQPISEVQTTFGITFKF
ncbi:MAG: hypothetical protein JWR02_3138 [Mucilaginibacter sp.]|nr:hypothetical protein [Mucilaginibacter sp.]